MHFNPRAPYGARHRRDRPDRPGVGISIHAPHTGRDAAVVNNMAVTVEFQSTRPIRGATRKCAKIGQICSYFNPRAPYGARPLKKSGTANTQSFQSTRPIRGATRAKIIRITGIKNFNPRAPYGARRVQTGKRDGCNHFNPRAPYGARLALRLHQLDIVHISIRAPHMGRDLPKSCPAAWTRISIRAPHMGRDGPQPQEKYPGQADFNPRAPYGARLPLPTLSILIIPFQSTRPIRGATTELAISMFEWKFQSTHPIRGATSRC